MGSAYALRQSFLHNRLGGLQVLLPGTDEWKYVKVGQYHRFSWRVCLFTYLLANARACNLQPRRRDGDIQCWYLALESSPGRVSLYAGRHFPQLILPPESHS